MAGNTFTQSSYQSEKSNHQVQQRYLHFSIPVPSDPLTRSFGTFLILQLLMAFFLGLVLVVRGLLATVSSPHQATVECVLGYCRMCSGLLSNVFWWALGADCISPDVNHAKYRSWNGSHVIRFGRSHNISKTIDIAYDRNGTHLRLTITVRTFRCPTGRSWEMVPEPSIAVPFSWN